MLSLFYALTTILYFLKGIIQTICTNQPCRMVITFCVSGRGKVLGSRLSVCLGLWHQRCAPLLSQDYVVHHDLSCAPPTCVVQVSVDFRFSQVDPCLLENHPGGLATIYIIAHCIPTDMIAFFPGPHNPLTTLKTKWILDNLLWRKVIL